MPTKKFPRFPFEPVNLAIEFFIHNIPAIFDDQLIGLYLFGSLTYEDFMPNRSDIDLFAIIRKPSKLHEEKQIEVMHQQFEQNHPFWRHRIESQYVPISFFSQILPPTSPRPYFGAGKFYPLAPYGNEWLINNFLLYNYGVTLVGKDIKLTIPEPKISDVIEACVRDLHQEWLTKLDDSSYLIDPHQQSYVVLNLCRILYAVKKNQLGSKSVSANWVKHANPQWDSLISTAQKWEYGQPMNHAAETRQFLRFVSNEINNMPSIT